MIKYYYQDRSDSQLGEVDSFTKGSWMYTQAPTDAETQQLIIEVGSTKKTD
jgi:hypothetical protein